MSTRGFISFAIDGETKTAYNHSDSYPGWLGANVLEWASAVDLDAAATAARALRVVSPDSEPTDADITRFEPFTDTGVGARSERPSWYQLLRKTHGDPGATLEVGVIEDASDFPGDSLFAEWGYVVDLDAKTLEVYVGFQQEPHKAGRFASLSGRDGYFPVRLIKSWPLSDLPAVDAFVDACEKAGAR